MLIFFTLFSVQAEPSCILDQCDNAEVTPTSTQQSVLEQPLKPCGTAPITGFFRDGFCHTNDQDRGIHVVCAELTTEFLSYTKLQGNDLSTPKPQYNFPGLKPGDHWCLCAARWKQAHQAGVAPNVVLDATHTKTLQIVPLSDLLLKSTEATDASSAPRTAY